VITLNYSFWSVLFVFIYVYVEIFNQIIFYSIFKNTKNFVINYSKKNNKNINNKNIFPFLFYFLFIYILFLKSSFVNNFILTIFFIYLLIIQFSKEEISSNQNFLLFNICFFLILFNYINLMITFFLYVEVYAVIFYFFFIVYDKKKNINILEYKNMLLLYLFNNFFSTISFLLGIHYLVFYYGTLNFTELSYINITPHWEFYFVIVSFIIKLSLPGFHFLKIEIYKYLSFDIIIIYSIFTLLLNFTFMVFLFNQPVVYVNLQNYKLFNLFIMLSMVIFIHKLKLNNFNEFVAYSGFSTNTLIIINYLIINKNLMR
jgi:hypothetical protein